MKKLLVCLLAICVAVPLQARRPSKKRIAAFERQIEEFRKDIENVGLSVALVLNNKIVYTQQFGVKNIETQEPIRENTLFRIASISKSFTTTGLLQLVEQGKVSLTTDVSQLAGFTIRNPKYPDTVITLEMLLSHTSSINDSQGYYTTLDVINPDKNPDYAKCYNNYEPGKGYEYCNLNLNLSGSFLEKLSGERFDQYVVRHILRPLGLYGGYCVDSLDAGRFASLYEYRDGKYECTDQSAYNPRSQEISQYVRGRDAILFSPTGGMKMSAKDLAKYMLVHMNYGTSPQGVKIIPEELSKSMQVPRSTDENYGLSLWTTDEYSPGVVLVGHTGGAYGMRSAMFFNPEKKYGFVMMSNGARARAKDKKTNIIKGVLQRMYDNFVRK
jgi:CubicO group peptidase (beta-lactamase class C family)